MDRNPLRKVALTVGGLTGIIGGLLSAGVLFGVLSSAQADALRVIGEQLPGWLLAVGALVPFLTGAVSSLVSAFGTAKVGERSVTSLVDPRDNDGTRLVREDAL